MHCAKSTDMAGVDGYVLSISGSLSALSMPFKVQKTAFQKIEMLEMVIIMSSNEDLSCLGLYLNKFDPKMHGAPTDGHSIT
jgi:hypothetical protein